MCILEGKIHLNKMKLKNTKSVVAVVSALIKVSLYSH